MMSQIQEVFSEGYNRLQWDVQETGFFGPKVDPREMSVAASKSAAPVAETQPVTPSMPTKPIVSGAPDPGAQMVDMHDRKNQLSSLVQNARRNEEAIKSRNERIKQAKQQSRARYGW